MAAGLKIQAFSGIAPRISPTLLADNAAQTAMNTKLYSGELRAWNKPGVLDTPATCKADALTIYKHHNVSGDDLWLSWSTDVDVVRGPIYANSEFPIYYTGDGAPKKTNAALASTGTDHPGDYLMMGVPTPVIAPSVVSTGGSSGSTPETRTYLYTFISQFGSIEEESAPSPASATVSVLYGGQVNITGLPSAAPAGKYNIQKVRIYRSVTGTSTTVFLKVADVPIGTTTYVDNVSATALGVTLPSATWGPPPDDLKGIVGMANGILAGFRGNEVWFCEPYTPHAWPAGYALTVEYPIVGIKAAGESLVVTTAGNPFIITGASPAAMSQTMLTLYEPCISKRSIASDEDGVVYASPNGIIKVSLSFAGNAIRTLFTREDWLKFYPASMLGLILDGRYHLFYRDELTGTQGALILDRNDANMALTTTSMFTTAAHVEPTSAGMYVADAGMVKKWEGDPYAFLPYEWKSKLFILPRPLNFGAAQIEADFGNIQLALAQKMENAAIVQQNITIFATTPNLQSTLDQQGALGERVLGGSLMKVVPLLAVDQRYVTLTVFCQGKQVAAINVKSTDPFRLPSGFKGDKWEFQLSGNIPVRHLKIAETSRGLIDL